MVGILWEIVKFGHSLKHEQKWILTTDLFKGFIIITFFWFKVTNHISFGLLQKNWLFQYSYNVILFQEIYKKLH